MISVLGLLLLVIILIVSGIAIYVIFNYREACERWANYFMRKMGFFIILFCLMSAMAEDVSLLEDPDFSEPDPFGGITSVLDPGPVIIPEFPKATYEINIIYYGLLGETNITTFNNEWQTFLNETNLTA